MTVNEAISRLIPNGDSWAEEIERPHDLVMLNSRLRHEGDGFYRAIRVEGHYYIIRIP